MIIYENEAKSDAEILEILEDEIRTWFLNRYKTFTPPQRYSILNIHNKNNVLISSPTGSGKTLSAFLAILNELFKLSKGNKLEDKIYAIYVSPLKALNNDIKRNLLEPLEEIEKASGINHGIRIAVRNSDTTSNEKSKMLRKPPHILITTPESLTLSLTSSKFKEKLLETEWIIVDEIHALAENKRGALLSLSIERLDSLKKKPLVRIGLSATVSPLEEVAKYLVGSKGHCKMIDVQAIKEIEMKIITPVNDLINLPFEKIHNEMYKKIHELIQSHKTTLIFTNTRSATERVVYYLKEKFNYSDLEIGAHHSSLSKEIRQDIEERMKSGKLKVIVSSTSLELGIDIGSIDLVILLSSPKSIARALQRIGRSGHKLHEKSKGIFISLDNDDLLECCVLKRCAEKRKIDNIKIPKNPLDVLAQHLVSMAYEEIDVNIAYEIIKRSYNFESLSREDFEEMLKFLAGQYNDLEEKKVYGKIKIENGKILPRKGARMIFLLNSGVIPDTSDVVVLLKNKSIGFIDELFLERLNKNDIFVLGGKTYRFLKASGMACFVENADGLTPTVPSWFSESLPLSYDLAIEILNFRKKLDHWLDENDSTIVDKIRKELNVSSEIAKIILDYFYEQKKYIGIPNSEKMIIEIYRDNETKIIFHTLFGRRVNDVLSRAAADILSRMIYSDVLININDNAFSLSISETISKDDVYFLYQELLSYDLNNVEKIIENTELFFRRFRHVATRSFLVLKNYKGKKRSVNKQQLSAKQIYNIIKSINPNFVLIKETKREILEDHMDLSNAKNAQNLMKKMNFEIVKVKYPSPFALNLILDSYADLLKAETKHEFLKKMHSLILHQISKKI